MGNGDPSWWHICCILNSDVLSVASSCRTCRTFSIVFSWPSWTRIHWVGFETWLHLIGTSKCLLQGSWTLWHSLCNELWHDFPDFRTTYDWILKCWIFLTEFEERSASSLESRISQARELSLCLCSVGLVSTSQVNLLNCSFATPEGRIQD